MTVRSLLWHYNHLNESDALCNLAKIWVTLNSDCNLFLLQVSREPGRPH